jgi:hypothetical protein
MTIVRKRSPRERAIAAGQFEWVEFCRPPPLSRVKVGAPWPKEAEYVLVSEAASHRRPALPHHAQSFEVDLAVLGLFEQGQGFEPPRVVLEVPLTGGRIPVPKTKSTKLTYKDFLGLRIQPGRRNILYRLGRGVLQ